MATDTADTAPIRVLHLFSNHKWTGPAEPALNLCAALRRAGADTVFACAPGPDGGVNTLVETARDRGVEPLLSFRLGKHRNPWRNFFDGLALNRWLLENPCDLIHCHLDNAHEIALGPAQKRGIPVVRSSYEGTGFPETPRHRRLMRAAAAVIEPSEMAREHDTAAFGLEPERAVVIPNAVDTERFHPTRELPDGRRWLNLPPSAFIIGIVARMQTHRHYEDLFGALARLVKDAPNAHLVVVGRGTKQAQVGFEPVKRLGLEKHVHFTGYIAGENYAGMLRAFDAGVFLVPGSDGTCRAAREIMASGRPVAAADRGMLREIVHHGEDGLIFDGSTEGLLRAVASLCADRALCARLGQNARRTAETSYSLSAQAAAVMNLYRAVLSRRSG